MNTPRYETRQYTKALIHYLRYKGELTQKELCFHAKMNETQLSRYATGVVTPSFETIVKLEKLYRNKIGEHIGREDLYHLREKYLYKDYVPQTNTD